MCYGIVTTSVEHSDDSTVATCVRRSHAFDRWNKIQIKMEVENDKLIEPMYREY